jgi:hypothetical protein
MKSFKEIFSLVSLALIAGIVHVHRHRGPNAFDAPRRDRRQR